MLGLCRLRTRSSRQPRHRGIPCGCAHRATKLIGVAPLSQVCLKTPKRNPMKSANVRVLIIFLIKLAILGVYPGLPMGYPTFRHTLIHWNTFKYILTGMTNPVSIQDGNLAHPHFGRDPELGTSFFASVRLWKEPRWTKVQLP